ncbi:hypothetical protein SAMN05421640_0559 [Ekhidna lutea]|uniref:Right handed beta helix region n=1 Tax=Ekhidna lutea TaxID=447679 RepID=A0A239FB87_EKHLU|nr:hypothetical protein [Ekhidna lutea]SNS53432.1 hypothetical protein SAMN05421640_0559 [Ekhidna lutea]
MKKLFAIAMLITGGLMMVSCGEDDTTTIEVPVNELEGGLGVLVENNITANTTWSADSVYVLTGRIAVEAGSTLTIEAGTIIKGQAGTGANATALIIARGATINAQGTSSAPIIMTSVADEIEPGQIDSPNLSDDVDGLWGGLIVLGNATISVSGDAESTNIEGIPATDANGLYGGTANNDNSGVITYVSVRHGGSNIGEGNEINGITFGGVGSGTTVNHIEVVANQDDGVEFFGGAVNVNHVLVWNNGDDAIDTDQGYVGTINNGLIINPGDKAFELDGGEGTEEPAHTITNFSVMLGGAGGSIDTDSDTNVDITGVYFYGMNEDTGSSYDFDATTSTFTSIEVADTWDDDGSARSVTAGQFADAAFETLVSNPTVGANTSEFNSWTMASLRSAF